MKLFTKGLALAAMLGCMPALHAELVLDDFSSGAFTLLDPPAVLNSVSGALTNDVAGNFQYSVSNGILTGGAGNLTSSFTTLGSSFTLSYTGLPNLDLHSAGAFAGSPLLLNLFDTVAGAFELVATYSSGADSATLGPIAITSAGPVGLSGADFGDGALASSVTGIDLVFTVTGLDAGTGQALTTAGNASIAAVPEPASIALLGLTGLGGVVVARRRRKQAVAAA